MHWMSFVNWPGCMGDGAVGGVPGCFVFDRSQNWNAVSTCPASLAVHSVNVFIRSPSSIAGTILRAFAKPRLTRGLLVRQPRHEWVIVLKGAARLQFEDGIVEMKVGDFINIPAFKKRRVDWTTPDEPTVWLGVRYGEAT